MEWESGYMLRKFIYPKQQLTQHIREIYKCDLSYKLPQKWRLGCESVLAHMSEMKSLIRSGGT